MKNTLYIAYFPLLQILPNPPPCPLPCQLQDPPSLLFFWLIGWLCHIWCAILLTYIMDLHMFSLGTFAPDGLWWVFYARRRQVHWALTNNVVFCRYSNLISHTYTHKDTLRHTAHSESSRFTHPINIYLRHLWCAHGSRLYYLEWIIHRYQKITFYGVFSFQQLFTCKGHISVD